MQNRCSKKSRKIHGKTLLLESLLKKAADFRSATFIKVTPEHRRFPVNFWKISKNTLLQNTSGRLLK